MPLTYSFFSPFQEFVKQLQLCELVVARANFLRYKFQDALVKGTETDKDVKHFLSALMGKPEVTVIGAGRGPAGRVLHSLFVKQEVCIVMCYFFLFQRHHWKGVASFNRSVTFLWYCLNKDIDPLHIRMTPVHNHS